MDDIVIIFILQLGNTYTERLNKLTKVIQLLSVRPRMPSQSLTLKSLLLTSTQYSSENELSAELCLCGKENCSEEKVLQWSFNGQLKICCGE